MKMTYLQGTRKMKKTSSEDLLKDHMWRKIFSPIPESLQKYYHMIDTKETLIKELTIEKHRPKERKKGVITFYQRNENGEKIKLHSYKSRQKSRHELEMENLIEVKDLLQYFSDLDCP